MMMKTKLGEDVMQQIAEQAMMKHTKLEVGMEFLPKTGPEITWDPGEMNIKYEMEKLNIDWKNHSIKQSGHIVNKRLAENLGSDLQRRVVAAVIVHKLLDGHRRVHVLDVHDLLAEEDKKWIEYYKDQGEYNHLQEMADEKVYMDLGMGMKTVLPAAPACGIFAGTLGDAQLGSGTCTPPAETLTPR